LGTRLAIRAADACVKSTLFSPFITRVGTAIVLTTSSGT